LNLRTVRSYVDKVFTYATPHNGIEMAGINVPSWLAMNDTNNFNRERMAEYLGLEKDPEYLAQKKAKGRVDFLRNYPLDRFFCMIGTNRSDYNVAAGLSRSFAGNGSDGLVKIDNASVYGKDALGNSIASPRAYAFRSHSGFFGIVNSEEAFQNLTRFLFGDLRVDIWFDVDSVSLPGKLEDDADNIEAGYQFELLGAPRGKPWYLTRRISEEDSVAVRTHAELTAPGKKEIYLSTVFLSSWAKVDMTDTTLSYAVTFRAGVQEYLVNGMLFTSHFEGVKLFSDTIIVSLTPDEKVEWKWAQDTATGEHVFNSSEIDELQAGRSLTLPIPIPVIIKPRKAGIAGKLRFVVTNWNIA
jgi:hypothetical protein